MKRQGICLNVRRLQRILAASLCLFQFLGCHDFQHPISQNETLRLTQQEIVMYTQRANAGDADAANRLWMHYDFAERDHEHGVFWKKRYEQLADARDHGGHK